MEQMLVALDPPHHHGKLAVFKLQDYLGGGIGAHVEDSATLEFAGGGRYTIYTICKTRAYIT